MREAIESSQRDLRQAMLAKMNVVRVGRSAVQDIEAEVDAFTARVYEIGVILLGEAGLLNLFPDAKLLESLDHTPVINGGPRGVDDPRFGLDHGHAYASLRQPERTDEARRTTADDH